MPTLMAKEYHAYAHRKADQLSDPPSLRGCYFCQENHFSAECDAVLSLGMTMVREHFLELDAEELPEPTVCAAKFMDSAWIANASLSTLPVAERLFVGKVKRKGSADAACSAAVWMAARMLWLAKNVDLSDFSDERINDAITE